MPEPSAEQNKPSVTINPFFIGWKNVLLALLFGTTIIATGLAGYYYFQLKGVKAPPSSSPPKTATTSAKKDETVGWKTYTDNKLKFSFKYPPNPLEPQRALGDTTFVVGYPIREEFRSDPQIAKSVDNKTYWITLGYTSQNQLDSMGIDYCGANISDSSRCEPIKVGGAESIIDWGIPVDSQIKAYVSIPHPKGGVVTFELQPVVPESKETLYQILATFKFLD
jgi:hypothetical protein